MRNIEEDLINGKYLEDYFDVCPSDMEADININDWVRSGWTGDINLDLVLSYAIEEGASDIHVVGGQTICFTVLGDIIKKDQFSIPDEYIMNDIVTGMMTHQAMGVYVKDLEYDMSYKIRFGPYKNRRFRVNVGKSFDLNQLTFRVISDVIPTPEQLGITDDLIKWFDNSSGVILICGATGSGKSNTLASILRKIQLERKLKIITVEKPVEFVYPSDGQSLIVQRAIPEDCLDFSSGLTSAMRSAPNIIMIGEVRNKEEVDELLRAAETGHLALSTIHTANNVTTINRIRSLYEGEEQRRILSTLGDTLRGVLNQTLVKAYDGKSRFAVREYIQIDYKLRKLISEDKVSEIRKLQEENHSTMEHNLVAVVMNGKCRYEDARDKAPDQIYFDEIYNSYIEQGIVPQINEFLVEEEPIEEEEEIEIVSEVENVEEDSNIHLQEDFIDVEEKSTPPVQSQSTQDDLLAMLDEW